MSDKEISEKVALLKDGQIVEIDGNCYKAIRVSPAWRGEECYYCEVDSNCRDNVTVICSELDVLAKNPYLLRLIS